MVVFIIGGGGAGAGADGVAAAAAGDSSGKRPKVYFQLWVLCLLLFCFILFSTLLPWKKFKIILSHCNKK